MIAPTVTRVLRKTCDDVGMATFQAEPGAAHPVGITVYPDGVNLSLFSDFGTLGILRGVAKSACNPLLSCIHDDLAFRQSVGIAVNWKSPFGPVEIDLGYPLIKQGYDKPQAIRLSAGTNF